MVLIRAGTIPFVKVGEAMTVEDLELVLAPVVEALDAQNDMLTDLHDLLTHLTEVQYGIILGLGVVAGLILIYLLLRKF